MKTLLGAMQTHIGLAETTLCLCWSMVLTDGTELYYTDHDEPVVFGGNRYQAYTGVIPSATQSSSNLSVDNMEVVMGWNADFTTETQIRGGRFDYATIEVFMVNYADPTTCGEIPIIKGKIGEITLEDNKVRIDLRGMVQYLHQQMGENYSAGCQSTFGDARCKLDATDADYTKAFTVGGIVPATVKRKFTSTQLTGLSDGYFEGGFVRWLTGNNSNTAKDVKVFTTAAGSVELYEPLIRDIAVGDTGEIVVGCDGNEETCKTKFNDNNIVNFRGFPHLTGIADMLRGP